MRALPSNSRRGQRTPDPDIIEEKPAKAASSGVTGAQSSTEQSFDLRIMPAGAPRARSQLHAVFAEQLAGGVHRIHAGLVLNRRKFFVALHLEHQTVIL